VVSRDQAFGRAAEAPPEFLASTSEVAALMRTLDWSKTALGRIETWSASLRMMVSFLLANRFPLLLWWGPDYISIYNDAYRPILGAKHPWALGKPVRECWSEIWSVLQPLIDAPFTGGPSTWMDDIELHIQRKGYTEETHFTVAYSPVPDETAPRGIGGVLATVHEITDKVVGERRLKVLRDLGARTSDAKSAVDACVAAAETLAMHPKDFPFALLYLLGPDAEYARLAGACGVEIGDSISPETIQLGRRDAAWPLASCKATEAMQVVQNLGALFHPAPAGLWPDPPHTAVVLPIQSNMAHQLAGFMVAGVSSRLNLDDTYKNFLQLATVQVATLVANASAYEEARKREAALAELDRAKIAFFSNVSHEFRTPLTLMLGPLEELLSADNALSAKATESLSVAHRNGLRLQKLVNTLLDFSRIEAGRVQASYEPTNLARLTADLASNFRSAMDKAGLQFTIDCPDLPEAIYVDPEMWEKVVLNLLSNAFKHTFEGEIAVRLGWNGDHVSLAISDTGIGIAPDDRAHIFERFHRVRGARARTHEGTGIGLALVSELVKLQGGSIHLASEVGLGTTFTVSIPSGSAHLPKGSNEPPRAYRSTSTSVESFVEEALRWIPEGGGDGIHASQSEPGSKRLESRDTRVTSLTGERPKVLIADDNADMRDYLTRLLTPSFEAAAVTNGATALQFVKENEPDLVLADVMMPGLDGFELLRALRSDERFNTIPMILLSARAGEEARVEGLEAGADDYLTKPFSSRELVARVESHIKLARIRREAEKAVRHAAEFNEAIVSNMGEGLYTVDAQGCVTSLNPAAEAMFGWSLDELRGKRMHDVTHYMHTDGTPFPAEECAGFQVLHAGKSLTGHEDVFIRKDGTFFDVVLSSAPLWEGNQISGLVVVFSDVSDRKATEKELKRNNEALQRANADLEQFAYSASHDLQEPIRNIAVSGDVMSRRYGDLLDAKGRACLGFITGGAKRMESLVKDLLAYTQSASADEEPHAAGDANAALAKALDNLSAATTETAAEVSHAALPQLRMSEIQLQQLFQNLIGNAIKYRKDGETPRIHVGATRKGKEWVVSVRDNGIGIPEEYKEQVFGIFKRLHTDAKYSGTGIGLAICQKVVERNGGRIWLESEGVGKGSTFFFSVPA
jgi:PAS domain S-box-containing protein